MSGDLVTIDLVATKDGEALPDATAEGLEYEMARGACSTAWTTP